MATPEQLRRNFERRVAKASAEHLPEILRHRGEGCTRIQIAERLGLERRVVGGVLAEHAPEPPKPPRPEKPTGQGGGKPTWSAQFVERRLDEPMSGRCVCGGWRAEGPAREVIEAAHRAHRERCPARASAVAA